MVSSLQDFLSKCCIIYIFDVVNLPACPNSELRGNCESYVQSVGLLGRGSACHRAVTYTGQHREERSCLGWDSNPRPQCSNGQIFHAPDRKVTVIGYVIFLKYKS
jgi:hypothetical protein